MFHCQLFVMAALCNRAGQYIYLPCGFYLLSSFFFSSSNLSGRRLYVYHTSTHSVALVRIYNACLKCAARRSLKIQDAKNRHFGTIAQLVGLYLDSWGMYRQSEKIFWNIDTSPTCLHNMVNVALLTAEICWRVSGTPANFNGFHVLATLLHSTLVVGVSQTLRRWTEGTTYTRQGDHQVGHWPTF